jgi:hypothetical protein
MIQKASAVLTHAGTNRDSEGLVKELLNDPGFHMNRKVIKKQFKTNSIKLKRNNITPITLSQSERYGTAFCQR